MSEAESKEQQDAPAGAEGEATEAVGGEGEAPQGAESEQAGEAEKAEKTERTEPAESGNAELESWKARAYRAAADLENTRRRFGKEREELRKFGIEGVLKDLFPVVDNLERAVAHTETDNPVAEGVRMVLRQFSNVLAQRGAKSFDPKGEKFDPQYHEAMTQMVSSEVEPGHVVEVFQRGWMLHDRLVRPAMVVVAQAPEVTEDEGDASAEDAEAGDEAADE